MNTLLDLSVNLLAAGIGFAIAQAIAALRRANKVRRARAFWQPFIRGEFRVVLGVHPSPGAETHWDPQGLAGVGDVAALTEVDRLLKKVGIRSYQVRFADRLGPSDLEASLVLIGGPDVNPVTRRVMDSLPLRYVFSNPEARKVEFTDWSARVTLLRSNYFARRSPLDFDRGIVIRADNPFAPRAKVLVLAGSHGFATAAAATLLADPEFAKHPTVRKGGDFEAFFTNFIVQEIGQAPKILELRELSEIDLEPERSRYMTAVRQEADAGRPRP